MRAKWITLNQTQNVVRCSSNSTKQERSCLLGLVGFLCFCTSVTVICDQTIPENVSTAVHLFTFPGPGEAFTPHLRSVLLHSSAVVHTNWNPVRQGRLVLSCGVRNGSVKVERKRRWGNVWPYQQVRMVLLIFFGTC